MARPTVELRTPFGGWVRFAVDFCRAGLQQIFRGLSSHRYPESALSQSDAERVDYYCQLSNVETKDFMSGNPRSLARYPLTQRTRYRVDLFRALGRLPARFRFYAELGDITEVPKRPSFVKSRPVRGAIGNAVLLPLNTRRHFVFVRDSVPFPQKKDGIVWRGAVYRDKRKQFLTLAAGLPFCDVGVVAYKDPSLAPYRKPKLSIAEQLGYKFIFSIEGNDVATNLKWVLSSNSVCFMPPPEFETWFMEGRLQAGVHYVPLKPDFSDIAQQYDFYVNRPALCQQIIANSQQYVAQFMDSGHELELARAVATRYAQHTGQI